MLVHLACFSYKGEWACQISIAKYIKWARFQEFQLKRIFIIVLLLRHWSA